MLELFLEKFIGIKGFKGIISIFLVIFGILSFIQFIFITHMVLTKKQKKELVIKKYEDGYTTRDIAKEVRISLRDIGIILREYNKEPEPKPPKSDHAKAFQLFSIGKTPTQVSIIVDLSYEIVKRWYFEYLSLNNKSDFVNVLYKYPEFLPFFVGIADKMKRGELFREQVDYMLANLIYCRASQHRKEWLEHEIRCLEAENKRLVVENIRLDSDIKSKRSYSPDRFSSLTDDL